MGYDMSVKIIHSQIVHNIKTDDLIDVGGTHTFTIGGDHNTHRIVFRNIAGLAGLDYVIKDDVIVYASLNGSPIPVEHAVTILDTYKDYHLYYDVHAQTFTGVNIPEYVFLGLLDIIRCLIYDLHWYIPVESSHNHIIN